MARKQTRRGFVKSAGLATGGLLGASVAPGASEQPAPQAAPSKGARFRALLARPEPLLCPAVHDVLTARLCELEGFSAVTVGGSAASASAHGVPDTGLVSITELVAFAGGIAAHTDLPVLADGDDGGGSPNNVYRATQSFEQAGVAAIMYEDTVQVKHLQRRGGELVSSAQMVDKIKAALDARRDPGLVVVARCDALAEGYGMDEALARGHAYAEAGADVLFFSGMSLADTPRARDAMGKPLMSTVGPTTTPAQLQAGRISLAVHAGVLLNVATGAAHQALKELRATGKVERAAQMAVAPDVYAQLIGTEAYVERGRKYHLIK